MMLITRFKVRTIIVDISYFSEVFRLSVVFLLLFIFDDHNNWGKLSVLGMKLKSRWCIFWYFFT